MRFLRIKSRFIDADGEREIDDVIPRNQEGLEAIEKVWVRSFREMLLDAWKSGDDVEIQIRRVPTPNSKTYVL